MTTKNAVAPDREALSAARADATEARGLLEAARSVEIASASDYAAAAETAAELRAMREAVEARRRSWVDPLNAVVRSINAAFKPAFDTLAGAERAIRDKIVAYSEAQAAAHEAAVRRSPRRRPRRGARMRTRACPRRSCRALRGSRWWRRGTARWWTPRSYRASTWYQTCGSSWRPPARPAGTRRFPGGGRSGRPGRGWRSRGGSETVSEAAPRVDPLPCDPLAKQATT